MKTTLASMVLLLGLVALALVPTVTTTADQCPAAVSAPVSQPGAPGQADQPSQAPDQGEGLESDLFRPEPLPLCKTGMCASTAQCPEGAECYLEPGWTCGYCLF